MTPQLEVFQTASGRMVLGISNGSSLPLRRAPYRCTEDGCGRPWFRVTDQKLCLPAACPFCGGRSLLSRDLEVLE